MKKYLITGATGLVGSHLISQLSEDHELYLVSRSFPSPVHPAALRAHQIQASLTESDFTQYFPPKIDSVVHLAQSSHFRHFPDQANDLFAVNVFATVQLLDYARRAGAKTFILASTGGVYGSGPSPFAEQTILQANGTLGFYPMSKLCAEMAARHYETFMNIVILRPFFIYGPHQKKEMLITRLINSVIEGKPIRLLGNEGIRINPVHVDDVVVAIHRALGLIQSAVINIAGPDHLSLRGIAEIIGELTDKAPVYEYETSLASQDILGDIQKMTELLGAPKVPFKEGAASYLRSLESTLSMRI